MTALACLKVTISEEMRFGDTETMATVVSKVAGAYLESTWLWPRRFGVVAPFSFVLTDPRATRLDARELQALARDLQQKLFGDKGQGEITLLMFEGNQADVMRFAGIAAQQVAALMAGEDDGLFLGRVCKITPSEVSSIIPKGGPVTGAPPLEQLALEPALPSPARVGYRGVFHTGQQTFIGNVAIWREEAAAAGFGFDPIKTEGDVAEYDIPTLQGALGALGALGVGVLFFPLSFSTLVKPSARAKLTPCLQKLPKHRRGQLAAAVYDTPRAPSFSALTQIQRYLDPYFVRIDLRVTDPAFQIDELPPRVAASVTLVLPSATEPVRLAAIRRFMREAPAYRRKGVFQSVSDVRTRRELNTCIDNDAPFLIGPAISDLMEQPADVLQCSHLHLPLRDWSLN